MEKGILNLTAVELEQLYSYVEHREQDGWYYQPKEHFEKRHETIKQAIANALLYIGRIDKEKYDELI